MMRAPVALANPDRLVFLDMAASAPYFSVRTMLDLEEDPGAVAGLLAGKDLLESARGHMRPGDLMLIPDETVNENGVFLDDLSPHDLAGELGVEVVPSWDPILAARGPGDGLEVDSVAVGAMS